MLRSSRSSKVHDAASSTNPHNPWTRVSLLKYICLYQPSTLSGLTGPDGEGLGEGERAEPVIR